MRPARNGGGRIAVRTTRKPGESGHLHAVEEVIETPGPVLRRHPEYTEHKIVERIREPERQIVLRVPWQDTRGAMHLNRILRVGSDSALGPKWGGALVRK